MKGVNSQQTLNLFHRHYVIQGPPDTPYHGGEYYGRLTFPSDYPYKPPSIRMSTPSGRFQPDTRLCLTMSDFHPSLWNPSWSVATILNGLLSFMVCNLTHSLASKYSSSFWIRQPMKIQQAASGRAMQRNESMLLDHIGQTWKCWNLEVKNITTKEGQSLMAFVCIL